MTCTYPFRAAQAWLAVVLASACVVDEPIDDGTATEATTTAGSEAGSTLGSGSGSPSTGEATADAGDATETTAESTAAADTTATGSATDDGSSSDTGSEGACSGVPAFQCTEPVDCFVPPCGDVFSPFDAEGCMRPPCTSQGDCNADQFCFMPYEAYDVCTSSGMTCSDGPDGTCECVSTPDCSGGYCMTDCHALGDDSDSCIAAGCSSTTVTGISDACACTEGVPVCLDGPGGVGIETGYLWHEETLEVAYFGPRLWAAPLQWRLCTDPGAPPACGCFDPSLPPECP